MSKRKRVGAALAVALAAVLGSALPAQASEGSVPLEVANFVAAPDGLIAELEEFLGPGVDGTGIDFDETTEMGTVDRVFTFSPAWLAGQTTDAPVILANEWTVPVTVGGTPVGVAVVWINPTTVRPQLADFVPNVTFATSLAEVPDAAYLVHDVDRAAWFRLEQPRLLALVSGASGVASETSLTLYQASLKNATDSPSAGKTADLGSVLSVATIVAVALIVILVLLVPAAWRRRKSRADEKRSCGASGDHLVLRRPKTAGSRKTQIPRRCMKQIFFAPSPCFCKHGPEHFFMPPGCRWLRHPTI